MLKALLPGSCVDAAIKFVSSVLLRIASTTNSFEHYHFWNNLDFNNILFTSTLTFVCIEDVVINKTFHCVSLRVFHAKLGEFLFESFLTLFDRKAAMRFVMLHQVLSLQRMPFVDCEKAMRKSSPFVKKSMIGNQTHLKKRLLAKRKKREISLSC